MRRSAESQSVTGWPHLKSNDSSIWREAFVALRLFGPAAGAVPALIEALDDPREVVQLEAADTLREIGPEAVAAAPVLVRKLGIREIQNGYRLQVVPGLDRDWSRGSAFLDQVSRGR